MHLALDTTAFFRDAAMPWAEVLDIAAAAGFEGLLLPADPRCAAPDDGPAVVGLRVDTDFGAVHPRLPLSDWQQLALDTLAARCAAVSGEVLVIDSGTAADPGAEARVVDSLRRAADTAAAQGVKLAVRNGLDVGATTTGLLALLEAVGHDACVGAFDARTAALLGEDGYQAARLAAPRASVALLGDVARRPRPRYDASTGDYRAGEAVAAVALGEGLLDAEQTLCGLLDGGFEGWVIYGHEHPPAGTPPAEDIPAAAQRLAAVLQGF